MNKFKNCHEHIFHYLRLLEQFVVHAEEAQEEFNSQLSFEVEPLL